MSVEMLGEIMNRPGENSGQRGLTPPLSGAIEFDRVTFRYPGTEKPALRDISLRIPRRQHDRHCRPQRFGQDHPVGAAAGPALCQRRRHPHRRPQYPRHRSGLSARPERRGAAGAVPVPRHHQGQYPHGRAHRQLRGRGAGGAPGRRRRVHPATCPSATTPSWRKAPSICPAARSSASPSPAPCCASRASSSSTRRPARWIPKARRWWSES